MASSKINYNPQSIGGDVLAKAVDHFRQGRDLLNRAKAIAMAVTAAGSIPTDLDNDASFGSPTGSVLFYAISDMKTAADNISDGMIANLDMG
jgi:hypothetical protein